ncbi:MAG: N-succinyl-L,L-diaminopimelate desuccinylase [uncultured Sphingosinicella sp.]|uniref:Succinyl-diaminopimelate desuccinylase n=1 Tax=uncultured Sphingosinicella sp. TaxID=478748 RepID=A0A6J4TIL4_9SPHN|nr:succinyl-diaminopimelate desuccinylase [uncultured Sphingosinicella sp.]CAA9523467.1 MAG: N-succinyl-L,L-diaminopimelate desuccinylase [uncultured Sphingosinicella sp.]
MTQPMDPVDLAARLIACPSITPASGAVFDVLEEALQAIGFTVHRFMSGEAPDGPVENLFATRGGGGPQFAFAGHLDVVPPGEGWTGEAFRPEIRNGLLYGRGAVDMKGGIASFVAAAAEVAEHSGTVSLIITGDEEGPATCGTVALMDWMAERGIWPDMIVIGEPTSVDRLGDTVKIGRRGTVNMWITVPGTQGHVAYPHRADNPVPKLARVLAALSALHLDDGTDAFQASNLEFTAVGTPTRATNVIPSAATAQLNIRFNNLHRGEDLVELVRRTAEEAAPGTTVEARISGEAFLTPAGPIYDIVREAIELETGIVPELSTSGGTSDGRFLIKLCPVVDFGLPNATMHKLDEAAAVDDIRKLQAIYARILRRALGPAA